MTTAPGPSARIFRAAASASATEAMAIPLSRSASIRFGVTTAARGRSFVVSNSTPASSRSATPLDDTRTGSTTSGASIAASRSATTSTISAVASMPVLTASSVSSSPTASICAATISGGSG